MSDAVPFLDEEKEQSQPQEEVTPEATPSAEAEETVGLSAEDKEAIESLYPEGHPAKASEENKDTKRYEYWQSKHDQLNNEFGQLKQKAEELEVYAPVAKYLKENPQALTLLEQQLSGQVQPQATTPQPSAVPEREEIKPPERPQRPSDFNPDEIHIDGTPSADYQRAYEKYLLDVADYPIKLQEQKQAEWQAQIQEQEQRIAAEQQFKMQQARLANEFKMTPEEVDSFMKFTNKPGDQTKELVEFFRWRNGQTQLKTEQFTQKNEKLEIPAPLGTHASESTPTLTDQDAFNLDILNKGKTPYGW